jgi:hypothetical protein
VTLGRTVSEAGLAQLSASRSLKVLDLSRTSVTDDGVKRLSRLKTLEELALNQTAVGDAGLAAIAQLPELRMLDLSETRVTSAGLASLAKLPKLEVLSLSWQTLTRDDLQAMSHLKQVRTIVLNGVPLPEATMARLRRLSPWESVAGLGTGPVQEPAARIDPLAMAVPMPVASPAVKIGDLPEIPKTSAAPIAPAPASGGQTAGGSVSGHSTFGSAPSNSTIAQRSAVRGTAEEMALAPAHPERIASARLAPSSAASLSTLKDAGRYPTSITAVGENPPKGNESPASARSAPPDVASGSEADSLLHAIMLQSKPTRGGAFYGLAGMRQLRRTETLASLDTLSAEAQPTASPPEDENPSQSLGEISVGVVGKKR